MKKLAICLVLIGFIVTGCTGSFNLTKKVYHIHRDQSDKWVDEIIFLACVIVPVYGIATFADGVIFNSIEFWTGDNPIASTDDGFNKVVVNGDIKAIMNYDRADETIQIRPLQGSNESMFTMARTDEGVIVIDANGNTMYTSTRDTMGGIGVYDADHNIIRYYSPQEVAETHMSYIR